MLNSVKVKPFYNSYDDNIINDFYNPLFMNAVGYDRVSAYFDSKILALYSCGLEKMYENNGKVRFIFSYDLSEEDYNQMKVGYNNRIIENLSQRINVDELSSEEQLLFSNLAFLIEIGLVDIKIAFTKKGIFHDKFGLISDSKDTVYFRGSNNETTAAIQYSYESFETTCTWNNIESELVKLNNAKVIFKRLWDNDVENVLVMDLPDVVRNKIISYSNGKIISYDNIVFTNKLVIDLGANNKVLFKNFLDPNVIDVRDRIFKVFLRKWLLVATNDNIEFKDGLSYVELKKIRDLLLEYSISNNFDIYFTDKFNNYIKLMDYQIDKRKSLGIDIKEHNDIVKSKFEEFKDIVSVEMERQLKPNQMWDSFHMVAMVKSANFSVPGSGKTSMVYGAFAYLNRVENRVVDKIVMIGPKNSFISWKDEFRANFGLKKTLKVLDSQDEKYKYKSKLIEDIKLNSANCNLILINYEKLPTISDELYNIINERTLLVFDEVHKIKAVNGVWAKEALKISENAKYKIVLTGTPIPNSYMDIYNLLNILYTNEYSEFFKFTARDLGNLNDYRITKVNEAIYPFYCRTSKKDLNIPVPNPDEKIEVNMTDDEKKLFELVRKKYSSNILSLYIRLLQAASLPRLLLSDLDDEVVNSFLHEEDDEVVETDYVKQISSKAIYDEEMISLINRIKVSSKIKESINLIEKLVKEGKKVIVWGIFIQTLNTISDFLNQRGISNKIICGSVEQKDRESIIYDFKNDKVDVLITNPHTLAESVSLHQNCHDAVYVEYSFNLTHMLQSRDRINRLGLKYDDYTQYYYMMLLGDDISNDSIDSRTYRRLVEKEKTMLESIEGTSLTRTDYDDLDEVRKILSDI